MDVAALVASLAPVLDGAVIATDFDGTLAPLQRDPQDSRPVEGSLAALTALAERGAHIAVITGRDAHTVLRLGGLATVPGLTVAGLYGAETWAEGELSTPDTPPAMESLQDQLPSVLADAYPDPDVWVEDKRLSLVVHVRRTADPDGALAALHDPVRGLAEDLELEMHPGAHVLELRLPGIDKAGALSRLVDEHDPRGVLYLGDDLGDLPAFAEIARLRDAGRTAWSVGVLSSSADAVRDACDVTVPDPRAVVTLLRALAQ
ncbi:MAG TPA: trehalose-phosphatase [Jatrophihabitans sp.]|uniref:trehalose-phosphatase n=1 Tax=Jatrophihabitans sp. TaxID=1932789 RepID=UPI002E001DE9|nr:trehalose-phosphatase [Jatrophihabitans sp.]